MWLRLWDAGFSLDEMLVLWEMAEEMNSKTYKPAHGGRKFENKVRTFVLKPRPIPHVMTTEEKTRSDAWREASRNNPDNAILGAKRRQELREKLNDR